MYEETVIDMFLFSGSAENLKPWNRLWKLL